jgi:hypothetical protein
MVRHALSKCMPYHLRSGFLSSLCKGLNFTRSKDNLNEHVMDVATLLIDQLKYVSIIFLLLLFLYSIITAILGSKHT